MAEYSKYGFTSTIQGVEYLDKIFELLEGKLEIKQIGWTKYWVWKDDSVITDEIKQYQKHLSKPWYSYKNNIKSRDIRQGLSQAQYEQALKEYQIREEEMKKREQRIAEKRKKKENADRGIYGIYCDGVLVYIGKTDVDFETRFKQHKSALENDNNDQFLYKYLKQRIGSHIELRPLINIKELKTNKKIYNRDIEAMELALITVLKPYCNVQGRLKEYQFTYN